MRNLLEVVGHLSRGHKGSVKESIGGRVCRGGLLGAVWGIIGFIESIRGSIDGSIEGSRRANGGSRRSIDGSIGDSRRSNGAI
ncbi:hypothetical protein ACLB2K_011564 [Fragaria x ananassa]